MELVGNLRSSSENRKLYAALGCTNQKSSATSRRQQAMFKRSDERAIRVVHKSTDPEAGDGSPQKFPSPGNRQLIHLAWVSPIEWDVELVGNCLPFGVRRAGTPRPKQGNAATHVCFGPRPNFLSRLGP